MRADLDGSGIVRFGSMDLRFEVVCAQPRKWSRDKVSWLKFGGLVAASWFGRFQLSCGIQFVFNACLELDVEGRSNVAQENARCTEGCSLFAGFKIPGGCPGEVQLELELEAGARGHGSGVPVHGASTPSWSWRSLTRGRHPQVG